MLKLGVISNPYARACRRNPDLNSTLRSLVEKGGLFRMTTNPAELTQAVREFRDAGVDCVGIVGGDGSINLVTGELLATYGKTDLPKILVLGGGTANVLALNIGIKGHPARVISDFLHVNNPTGSIPEVSFHSLIINGRLGFIFANGVAARYLQLFYANKGSARDAGLLLARAAFSSLLPTRKFPSRLRDELMESLGQAQPMQVEANPALGWARAPERFSAVFVSTIPKMAFGIPLFRRLETHSPQAEVLATSLENQMLAIQTVRAVLRRPLVHHEVASQLVTQVRVRSTPGSPYTIDGELFDEPADGVTIDVGVKLTFCCPSAPRRIGGEWTRHELTSQ